MIAARANLTAVAIICLAGRLAAQIPDMETCATPLSSFGDVGLPEEITETIELTADLVIGDVQIHTDFSHAFIGDITATVTSPSATTVTLHAGAGGEEDDLVVTWTDLGVPYGAASFQCDCTMQPSGPGMLADAAGSSAAGMWTLVATDAFLSSGGGTLDEWCVRVFLTAPPLPVTDLSCAEIGTGIAEVSWTNGADYDEVGVMIHGELLATLAGPFIAGETVVFTLLAQPTPQLAEICIVPSTIAAASGPARCCKVALPAEPAAEILLTPAARISGSLPPYLGTIFFTETLVLADLQVVVDVTYPFIGGLDINLVSPAGTGVDLHAGVGGFAANIDVTFWDIGLPNGPPFDCGCHMQPSGPGRLADFAGEPITGLWGIAVIATLEDAGTVDLVGIAGFDVGPAFPVENLTCAPGATLGTVEASWTHAADYTAINVYVNGELVEVMLGPFTAGTTGEFLTAPQPVPSRVDVGIEGEIEAAPGPIVACSATVFVEPISDLVCTAAGGTGITTALWTAPIAYDEINVYVNGALSATLDGSATSYSSEVLAIPGSTEICVEGILLGVGTSAEGCCRAILLESALVEACTTPALAVPPTFSATASTLEIAEVITIDVAEVVLDLTTAFVGDWDILLTSPEATVIQLHDNGGGGGIDLLVVYDTDGAAHGSTPFDCACAILPSGPGTLLDFAGELADGDWTLTLTTFTEGTLNNWCVRLDGCALLPPGDVVCATIGASVSVTWVNSEPYDGIDVYVNDALVASLAGDATSYTGSNLAAGGHVYRVAGTSTALACSAASEACRAAVGFIEYCNSDIEVAASSPGATDLLSIPETVIIDEAQVLLQMAAGFTSDFDLFIASPFGTEVQLHDNGGGIGGFNLVWSDGGAPNTGDSGLYDCDLCEVAPSGPGTLSDFAGEIATGDWVLSSGAFSNAGTISLWCLDLAPGCEVAPPSAVTCESAGNSVVLEWDNPGAYSSIEVERNGALLVVLAGMATTYADTSLLAGPYSYRIFGVSAADDCASGSLPCQLDHRLSEYCDAPALALPTAAESTSAMDAPDALPIQDVEVFVDLTIGFVTDLSSLAISSPAGTVTTLYDATFGTGANFNLTFSGAGEVADTESSLDCNGCRIFPGGPGSLASFEGEDAAGTWTITLVSGPFAASAVLNDWCVGIFEGCGAPPPSALTCTESGNDVELTWTNGDAYDAIIILEDGVSIGGLAGNATSYTAFGPPPGRHAYRVIGVDAALDCGSRSEYCGVAVARIDTCVAPALIVFGDFVTHEHELEVVAADELAIAELEVYLDISTGFAGNWDVISVESPAQTDVQLQDGGGGFTANFDVTYSDHGAPNTGQAGMYACGGCLVRPSGPGEMLDFAGEQGAGIWTLQMTTFEIGVLNEWCIGTFSAPERAPAGPAFLRGDANGDGVVNALLDALYLLNHQFGGGPSPPCRTAADANGDDDDAALIDALVLLGWQFNEAPPPPPPGPEACGLDPDGATDPLPCDLPPAACNAP